MKHYISLEDLALNEKIISIIASSTENKKRLLIITDLKRNKISYQVNHGEYCKPITEKKFKTVTKAIAYYNKI